MSSFTPHVFTTRAKRRLPRWLCLIGLPLSFALATQSYAACKYEIASEWNTGFTANIIITNSTSSPITSWSVSWQYANGDRMSNGWNATFSGTNPYSASNLGWNGSIAPNQSIQFGFQGTKSGSNAEIPTLTGAVCGTAATSSVAPASSSRAASSISSLRSSSSLAASSISSLRSSSSVTVPSSVAVSSSSSADAVNNGPWILDTEMSHINFVSTKNKDIVEAHTFTSISGGITESGVATVTLDLATVETGSNGRNQRVREHLFEVATYPTATITVNVPQALLNLPVGSIEQRDITASVNLHGKVVEITSKVTIQRLSYSRIVVQTLAPIMTSASSFDLVSGLDTLVSLVASVEQISTAVPVDFTFMFYTN